MDSENATQITVSSKYEVVIPREIREALDIQPGQKMRILRDGNRIELIPVRLRSHIFE
jgi:AbrB family looped-hinge helix DNA binding protein